MLFAGTRLIYYKSALRKSEVNEIVSRMRLSKGPSNNLNEEQNNGLSKSPNKKGCLIASFSEEELLHKVNVFCRRIQRLVKDERPCLVKSLILFEVCMAKGIDAHLVIGAGISQNNLDGHAWIEVGGVPFRENEEKLKRYTEMLRYSTRLPGQGENHGVT